MSSPYGAPRNPDTRQLPPGWITQFDANYNAWFYVNTLVQPPVTTWVHPLGAAPSPAAAYSPPPGGPPPDNRGYFPPQQQGSPYPGAYPGGGGSPYPPQQGGYNPGYQQPPPGQYSPYPPQQQQWQGAPPQEQGGKGLLSGIGGMFGGSHSQQPVYAQAPPKKSGMGMGTALALGARRFSAPLISVIADVRVRPRRWRPARGRTPCVGV
ncbi:hypothetical protein DFH09DRAFT_1156866 [Mycena vulgaris]|nr:hypothetical protein DFH09DRAFT_1156866 [Mycena vulgaris]